MITSVGMKRKNLKRRKTANKGKGVARGNNSAYSSPHKNFLTLICSNLHLKHFTISVLKHESRKEFLTGIRRSYCRKSE